MGNGDPTIDMHGWIPTPKGAPAAKVAATPDVAPPPETKGAKDTGVDMHGWIPTPKEGPKAPAKPVDYSENVPAFMKPAGEALKPYVHKVVELAQQTLRPGQWVGQHVQQATAPYLGDPASHVVGSTIGGFLNPMVPGPYGSILTGTGEAAKQTLKEAGAPESVQNIAEVAAPILLDAGPPTVRKIQSKLRSEEDVIASAKEAGETGAKETEAAQKQLTEAQAERERASTQALIDQRAKIQKQLAKQAQTEAQAAEMPAGRDVAQPEQGTGLASQDQIQRELQFRNAFSAPIQTARQSLKDEITAFQEKNAPQAPPPEDPNAMMARLRGDTGEVDPKTGEVVIKGPPKPPVTAPPPPEPPTPAGLRTPIDPRLTTTGVPYRSPEQMAGAPPAPPVAPRPMPAPSAPLTPELQMKSDLFERGIGDPHLSKLINENGLSSETMDYIMKNQQTGLQLFSAMNDAQKAVARDAIQDWFHNMGGQAKMTKDMAPLLKAAGFTGPMATTEGWFYKARAEDAVLDTMGRAPEVQQKFTNQLEQYATRQEEAAARADIKDCLKQADSIPKAIGGPIRKQIEAAQSLGTIEQARVAREAFSKITSDEARQTAEKAGIRDYTRPAPEGFARRLQNGSDRYFTFGLLMGRVRMMAMGLIKPVVAFKNWWADSWLQTLKDDPAKLTEFYNAYQNPGTQKGFTYLVGRAYDAANRQAGVQMQLQQNKPAQPPATPAPTSTPSGPGPMSKAIEQKQAYQIASDTRRIDPAHVDQVASLHADISTGGSPNVQHDLSSGRLSQGEVRKMVEPVQPDASQMFQGMELADAVEAFGRGSDEEKMFALPAIAQKLNDEGRNLSPVERRKMIATLRQSLPQEEAVG